MSITMSDLDGMSADDLVVCYIGLRDRKAELEEVKKQITEAMNIVEAKMLTVLEDSGADSIATANGTFFRKEKVTYSTSDWEAFWAFASAHPDGVFVTKTPRKASVDAYVEQYGELPPGLSVHTETVINVRRK